MEKMWGLNVYCWGFWRKWEKWEMGIHSFTPTLQVFVVVVFRCLVCVVRVCSRNETVNYIIILIFLFIIIFVGVDN